MAGMLVREKGTQSWVLSLGQVGDGGALGLQVHKRMYSEKSWYEWRELQKIDDLKWLFITQPENWECTPVEVMSPSHARVKWTKQAAASASSVSAGDDSQPPLGLTLRPTSVPVPLLQECCKQGFRSLSVPHIRRVAHAIGVEEPSREDDAELLRQCWSRAFGRPPTEEEFMKCLGSRIRTQSGDLPDCDFGEMEDVYDSFDWKEVEHHQENEKKKGDVRQKLAEMVENYAGKLARDKKSD
eukprot:1081120-Amphidinium_carterae.2